MQFGDKPDTKTRLSSNGPGRVGSDMDGLISFICTRELRISSFLFCATRSAAVRRKIRHR